MRTFPSNLKLIPHHFSLLSSALFLSLHSAMTYASETELEQINVVEESPTNSTEKSQSYTIKSMNTATGLRISGKDTPQSVSVITQKRLNDKAIHTLEEAMQNTAGMNVVRDSGLQTRFLSRGFYVDQIGEDGITTNVGGRSGYTAKIDVSPSTDLAIYDHIEVVRGASGLTQSNSEPGGTINLIRKRPTDKFQHLGEIDFDHRGGWRTMLDVSGKMNPQNTVRGRLIGVQEKSRSFKDKVHGKKSMIYGVTETNIGNIGLFTLGAMYQKINEVPDFAGVILPCENPQVSAFSSRPACNNPLTLPRNTYLGEDWSRLKGDKYNLFTESKFVLDNGWELKIEASYSKNNSDAKVGQFFIKDEHAAGISGSDADAFLTEKGEVIPFYPKAEALAKLKGYRQEVTAQYEKRKADYLAHQFNAAEFAQYRAQRMQSRQAGFAQCMEEVGLDFLCEPNWADPGENVDKKEYVDKKLVEEGIINNAANRFSDRLYDSAFNNRGITNRRFNYMPMRHQKKDEQYGIKLSLNGTYELFDRSHDFYLGYAFNNENIQSQYLEIFQKRYRPRPSTGAIHSQYDGRCEEDPIGSDSLPTETGRPEPAWDKYTEHGNVRVYEPGCKDALITKYKPVLDQNGKQVYRENDFGRLVPIYEPEYVRDANGNKVQETDADGNPLFVGFNGTTPVYKEVKIPDDYVDALYNYAKYVNKNKTHTVTLSTRFNATDKLHFLLGGSLVHYNTSQSKDMPVRYGQPLSNFQLAANNKIDQDHYTARMKGHKFTPYAGVTYDLNENQSLYASYTQIFKQQDNVDVTTKTTLPPLLGSNYEIGWKGSFFNQRLNSSVALFTLEQKNRTVVDFTFVPDSTGLRGSFQTIAKPIGKVVSKGVELELSGSLSENWQLFLGYTYNKSKYKNADEVNAARLEKNAKADPYNFSNFTPVQMLRIATSYHIPNSHWTIGGGVSAQSPTSSLYGIRQAGYALWDANVQYELNPHAKVGLIVSNLFDKTYFENNYNRTRGMNNFYGRPRTFLMKLSWVF